MSRPLEDAWQKHSILQPPSSTSSDLGGSKQVELTPSSQGRNGASAANPVRFTLGYTGVMLAYHTPRMVYRGIVGDGYPLQQLFLRST